MQVNWSYKHALCNDERLQGVKEFERCDLSEENFLFDPSPLLRNVIEKYRKQKMKVANKVIRLPTAVFFQCLKSLSSPRALRALGLLLADGAPTVGGGKTF